MSSRIRALAFLLITFHLSANYSAVVAYEDLVDSSAAKARVASCIVGRTAPPIGFWTWPANTRVNIYLREPDFSESDVSAVRLAVENWDASAADTGSNVRFTFHGLTRETRNAQGEMTILRKAVFKKAERHRAQLEAHSRQQDRHIDYALIFVDPSVQNPDLLTNLVAHEIGHSLGLLDCHKCNDRSTAMGLLKAGDESNGIEGPTFCDGLEVMSAYRGLKPRSPLIAVAE
jgi:hypothetical protein